MNRRPPAAPPRFDEETYHALFESAPDAVLVIDASGTIVATNPQAHRMFGYAEEELYGERIEKLMPERFRSAHSRYRHAYAADPTPRPMGSGLDLWGRHKSGKEFPVEISLSPLGPGEPALIAASVRDVSERKRARDLLMRARDELEDRVRERTAALIAEAAERERATEQLTRQAEMLDLASEPIFAWDFERGIVFWNKAATETYGFTRDQALGRNSHELLQTAHPGGTARIRDTLRRTGRWDGELTHSTHEGRKIVVESRMALLTTAGGERLVLESCRDITARRAAEDDLRQAQKLEAVGQLTGGIAHDFNNLLTIIIANLQLLEDELGPASSSADLVGSAMRAAKRGADLTRKLLIFARRQRLEAAPLDVNALVSSMTGMLGRTLGAQVQIVESLTPGLPAVLVDAGQLETALLNLAVNARDAMPHGGRLSIETRAQAVGPGDDPGSRDDALAPGTYVAIAVSDTGTGMDEEVAARAFEPFFTTKDAGKGTGLGLSMVYGFARQSGGHATLKSRLGTGTSVEILLPLAAHGSEVVVESKAEAESRGAETVLLVEDDDEVRVATTKLLTGLGYRVIGAQDGATALMLVQRQQGLDLLLTDVVLGTGMSGPELAREARRLRPDLKVLFVSGYVRDAAAFEHGLDQDAHFLPKPFQKDELARKLRIALAPRER